MKTEDLRRLYKEVSKIYDGVVLPSNESYKDAYIAFLEGYITSKINQLPKLPTKGRTGSDNICNCKSTNYGYGFAKCYDCGKIKDFKL